VLLDIVFMETVGMRPVVVHGGGAAIDRAMDAAGLAFRDEPGASSQTGVTPETS
jgi:acetylglutamate kinase